MAFQLSDGTKIPVDVPFTIGEINYPANWLRLTTKEEKEAVGITEVADPVYYDSRFYWPDGSKKALDDVNATDENGDLLKDENGDQVVTLGVKSILKADEKITAQRLLARYDWYVVRKSEKSTAIPTAVQTYRDAVRTACDTREKEIDACSDTAALITLFSNEVDSEGYFVKANMTQYPVDPKL
tara:strand:- start:117 stop:668 length:552 start_codon:yes stop_codon:yes gene_type:complete